MYLLNVYKQIIINLLKLSRIAIAIDVEIHV